MIERGFDWILDTVPAWIFIPAVVIASYAFVPLIMYFLSSEGSR